MPALRRGVRLSVPNEDDKLHAKRAIINERRIDLGGVT